MHYQIVAAATKIAITDIRPTVMAGPKSPDQSRPWRLNNTPLAFSPMMAPARAGSVTATKIAITGIRLTVMAGHCPGHQS